MAPVAFLGTGLLGSAFAEAAIERGDDVTVWNRTEAKAREIKGARVAKNPADAVRGAQRIHLILSDDAVVNDVIDSSRPGLDAKSIILDHTTTLPRLTAARAERLAGEGVRYLHCPVFIGPPAARQAKGRILVSGPRGLFDEVEAALRAQAEHVEYLGERSDLAAVYKLCGNAYIIGIASLVGDVFAMAGQAGVGPRDALGVLEYFDPRAIIAGRGRKMAARDFNATFELTMARKDVRLMLETAGDATLSVLPGIAERMDALIASGHGAEDLGAMGREAVLEWV